MAAHVRYMIVIGLLASILGASRASAATNPFQDIPISATMTASNGGLTTPVANFTGTLDITGFDLRGNDIVAVGSVTGTLEDDGGTAIGAVAAQPLLLNVTELSVADLPEVPGKCNLLHLGVGPLELRALGLTIHVNPVSLDLREDPASQKSVRGLFCQIDQLLRSRRQNLAILARRLSQVVHVYTTTP